MRREIAIETCRPGTHELPEPVRALAEVGLQRVAVDEQPLTQILPERAFAFGLSEAAEADEVVGLDAIEVVLGLRVHHAEDRVSIRAAAHVRDAPIVARDGHVMAFASRGEADCAAQGEQQT